jgi:tetratricopeptide (TPR) repeat protein
MRRWRSTVASLDALEETDEALGLGILTRTRLIRFGVRTGMALEEIEGLYVEGRALAERLGEGSLRMTLAYGTAKLLRGAIRESLELYVEAARLAGDAGDVAAQAMGGLGVGIWRSWTGPLSEAFAALDRLDDLCKGNADVGLELMGYSPLVRALLARAELLALTGRLEGARREADRGVVLARERSEPETLAWTLSIYPRLARTSAEAEDGLARAQEAVRVAEDFGNPMVQVSALGAVGVAELSLGRFGEAAATLERALDLARARQVALFEESPLLVHLARAYIGAGDGEAARRAADEAVEVAHRQGAPVVQCFALLTRARLCRATGDPPGAAADLATALGLAQETGASGYEAEIKAEQADLAANEQAPA